MQSGKHVSLGIQWLITAMIMGLGIIGPEAATARLTLKPEFYDFTIQEKGGTFVVINFKSQHPVVPSVIASKNIITVKAGGKEFATPAQNIAASAFMFLAGYRTNHTVLLKDLTPDTKFYVGIIGHRQQGVVYFPMLNKSFRTLKRKLTLNFNQVHILDDSDDLSDGEFKFGLFAYDDMVPPPEPALVNITIPGGTDSISIGTDETEEFTMRTSLIFNRQRIRIEVTAVDDDEDGVGFFESLGIGLATGVFVPVTADIGGQGNVAPHAGEGDEEFAEWGTASAAIKLEDRTNMSESATYTLREQYVIPFSMHTNPASSDLEFIAHGSLEVSYE